MGGEGNDPIGKTDWRIASSIVFYVTYALLGASLSGIEVKSIFLKIKLAKKWFENMLCFSCCFLHERDLVVNGSQLKIS
jgi:hypothetical protein